MAVPISLEHTGGPHFLISKVPSPQLGIQDFGECGPWIPFLGLCSHFYALPHYYLCLKCPSPHFGYPKSYPSLQAQGTEISIAVPSHPLIWEETFPSQYPSHSILSPSRLALSRVQHVCFQKSRYFVCVYMSFPVLDPLKVGGRYCAIFTWVFHHLHRTQCADSHIRGM